MAVRGEQVGKQHWGVERAQAAAAFCSFVFCCFAHSFEHQRVPKDLLEEATRVAKAAAADSDM